MPKPDMSIMPVTPQPTMNVPAQPNIAFRGQPAMGSMPVKPQGQLNQGQSMRQAGHPMQAGVNAGELGRPWATMFR